MQGKEKCKALKEIRKQIAENNDIKYVVDECEHKGDCKGTCPKCEAEVRYLEKELEKKRLLGQKVAIAGVSLGVAATFSACTTSIGDILPFGNNDLAGAPTAYEEDLGGATEIDPDEELLGEPIEIIPEDEIQDDESDITSDDELSDEEKDSDTELSDEDKDSDKNSSDEDKESDLDSNKESNDEESNEDSDNENSNSENK